MNDRNHVGAVMVDELPDTVALTRASANDQIVELERRLTEEGGSNNVTIFFQVGDCRYVQLLGPLWDRHGVRGSLERSLLPTGWQLRANHGRVAAAP